MAVDSFSADAYIEENVIDIEDWQGADDAKKERIVNVASRVLTQKYADYTVPDNAVYEYAASLATAFNDTNRMNNQGVAGFAVTGVGSFTFKETQKRDLEAFIPKTALDLIGAENGVKLGGKVVKWTVM